MTIRVAAKHGRIDLVREALSTRDREGLTELLRLATRDYHSVTKGTGHVAVVQALLEAGAIPDRRMVYEAARGGHHEIVHLLAASGFASDLFVASALGRTATVARLLAADAQRSATSDAAGMTPLHFCCASALGKAEGVMASTLTTVAEWLVEAGAPLNAEAAYGGLQQITPLVHACWTGGNLSIVQLLVERGAALSPLALWAAVGHFQRHGDGHYQIAERLLAYGLDLNQPHDGRTLLHAVSAHEDATGVAWLLAHGAEVTAQAHDGSTPLHGAARRNRGTQVVELLLAHGAPVEAVDATGRTPVELAVINRRHNIVQLLEQFSTRFSA